MAIGLVPHYSVVFPVEGFSKEQFLALVDEVSKKLEWDVPYKSQDGFIAYTKFRRRSINEKIYLNVDNGLVTLKSESLGGQFIDWGRNKKNIDEFISNYDDLRSGFTPEQLDLKFTELSQNQILNENITGSENGFQSTEKTKGILSIFLPVKGYTVTPIIIDLNILIFILMAVSGVNIMSPTTESLLKWGANFRPITLDGQPWRLLTNCFLHIGILHILFNMYAMLYIGILLEPRLGGWRFGIAYLVTGVIASVSSLYWHPMTISAGASGAIFGMYGIFLAMLTTNIIEKSRRKALLTSIAIFVGYNLLNGMKGGIDNAAHIGGLISGIIIGYSFYPGLTNFGSKKLNFALPAILILALLVFSSWEYGKISNDVFRYDKEMKTFFSNELKALELFKMPVSTSKEQLLSEIKDKDLNYWIENKNLVTSLDKLDLSAEIHKRNKKLIKYCDFRISSYELIYKAIDENSSQYKDQINNYMVSIDSLIKALK